MTKEQKALYIAGYMTGLENHPSGKEEWEHMADKLDIETLEKFLENPPSDFLYSEQCRRTIKLVKESRRSRNGLH